MSKRCAAPDRRRLVAGIALRSSTDVSGGLRLRVDSKIASAVAGGTLPGCSGVIHLGRSERSEILVAGITSRRSRNVRDILALRVTSVVAACAASGNYAGVGIGGRFPERCRVTDVAGLRRRNMGRRLGLGAQRGIATTVTGCAHPGRSRVIHCGRREGCEILVTGVTLATGRDMICGFSEG